MTQTRTILVRGWRFLPHSYAVVNQFQCLELLRRPAIRLYFEDAPYVAPHWKPVRGLFAGTVEDALTRLAPLPPNVVPDAEFRITYPYDLLRPTAAAKLVVFGTAEFHMVPPNYIVDQVPLDQAMAKNPGVIVATPSNWSRRGFIASGAPEARVTLLPHGVDTAIFKPFAPQSRIESRRRFGWPDQEQAFVFLCSGAFTMNKGVRYLLPAFARVLETHPSARLVLKGLDGLYRSKEMLSESGGLLSQEEVARIEPRITYVGESLSFADMAVLYNLADCYVSPYMAEGFNLPVLEAAACGLPVICTRGGSTDDFVTDNFALRVDSEKVPTTHNHEGGYLLLPSVDHLARQMIAAIEQPNFRLQAHEAGPTHVAAHWTWAHVVDRLLEILLPADA